MEGPDGTFQVWESASSWKHHGETDVSRASAAKIVNTCLKNLFFKKKNATKNVEAHVWSTKNGQLIVPSGERERAKSESHRKETLAMASPLWVGFGYYCWVGWMEGGKEKEWLVWPGHKFAQKEWRWGGRGGGGGGGGGLPSSPRSTKNSLLPLSLRN